MNEVVEPKFLVDFMLGRLAKWLRILGYDTRYARKEDNLNLGFESLKEDRIILTRNHSLSSKRAYALILIKSNFLFEQIKQLMETTHLEAFKNKIFTRCTICNSPIEPISKEAAKNRVPEYVYLTANKFSYCKLCNKIFWQGTHRELLDNEMINAGITIK